jgi:hypothetical protein
VIPERWQQVEELYHAALPLYGERTRGLLEKACRADGALRCQVESLLIHEQLNAGTMIVGVKEMSA